MILNLLNWIFIIFSTYLIGYGFLRLLSKLVGDIKISPDLSVMTGAMVLTVYAQVFSIFHGVGTLSLFIVIACSVIVLCVYRKEVFLKITINKNTVIRLCITAVFLIIFLMAASSTPHADDDYGYHIQAIEWINRYGVIKGQGILHFRFGYNSAFLSLQALLNWKSLTGYAYHGLNACFAFLISAYSIFTIKAKKSSYGTLSPSDILKAFTCIYMVLNYRSMIGVETDELVCIVFLYILIKWFEYAGEEMLLNNKAVLAIMTVWAVTLKVSVAPIMLIVLYVLWLFIKEKRYKEIAVYFMLSIAIAAPYLVRSVIISGYLFYPITSIDLFDVDWKLPRDIVDIDRYGITIWGRKMQSLVVDEGLTYESVASAKIGTWLPYWIKGIDNVSKVIFLVVVVAILDMTLSVIRTIRGNGGKAIDKYIPLVVAFACMIFWFSNAPLIRYGSFLMPVFILIEISTFHEDAIKYVTAIEAAACIIVICALILNGTIGKKVGIIKPRNYKKCEMVAEQTDHTDRNGNKITLYVPAKGGRCDAYLFPATNAQTHIDHLEFRGQFLEDGFKYKSDQQ